MVTIVVIYTTKQYLDSPASISLATPIPYPDVPRSKHKHHPVIPLPMVPSSGPCKVNGLAWACVGQDRDWGVVFIDHRPGERRTIDVVRMVERLVIINYYEA